MRYLKMYWKQIASFSVIGLILILGGYLYYDNNSISTSSVKKLSVDKKQDIKDDLSTVFVDVKGAVNSPGVYELDEGKRVIDAINLAGGLTDKADTININLSKKLTDEMYVIIYTKDEIYNYKQNNESVNDIKCASMECVCPDVSNDACINSASTVNSSPSSEAGNKVIDDDSKVSINNATKEELMKLEGIGEVKAEAIIKYRQENGSFKSVEELKNVSGIGDAVYDKIKDNIIV